MNVKLLSRINKFSLILSKCFYKFNFFLPGRLIARIRQSYTLDFLYRQNIELFSRTYNYKNLQKAEDYVFVMWYQGMDNLPPVIEKCLDSIRKHIRTKKIIYITFNNLKEFVEIPSCIYDKVLSGKISKTHFSDIARVALLRKYGGTWIDAACYLTKDIDEEYFNHIFYSPCGIHSELKKDFRYLFNKTKGWNISFQGSNVKEFPLYCFLTDYYFDYFSKYDYISDYFQTDFLISLFFKTNPEFYNIITSQQNNNEDEFELALLLNKKCTPSAMKKWESISSTFIHKLTYKKNWNLSPQSDRFSSYFFTHY